jgi:spore maturation protein CgeB
MTCLFFNNVLDKSVRETDIQTNGTVFHKIVQLLAYANYIDLIARSQPSLKEAFLALLVEEKTKYMITSQNTR